MSGLISRLIADDFTLGQIKSVVKCRLCGLESLENMFHREVCHNGTFCKQCIRTCSTCSAKKNPIPYLYQLLKSIKAKCQYYETGCNAILPFESLPSHEDNCQFNLQKWPQYTPKSPHQPSTPEPYTKSKQHPTNASMISKLNKDSFPNMDFVSQEAIQYSEETTELLPKISELEKRVLALECAKSANESLLLTFKQEFVKKIENCEKSIEESLKQFCEKYIIDRDFLWNAICSNSSKIALVDDEIKSTFIKRNQIIHCAAKRRIPFNEHPKSRQINKQQF